ncbi:MarR family winged helix-turn-helix transcriptional regulator [Microbacterium hydrocarbonoxydans]|uniref:MarR family winged helix-turn-helix transcriptional regulator n=1 Tax=Microbacterium hydrocarbonoxydans TaxID=273678 RepID=UPI0007BC4F1A|nr:MarR family transcriptional regulator [Microbacterium hydrocarbonoxydans]GAT71608.1 ydcH-like transcriptional regulator [Microbacterium sp. HM58-2]
MLTSRFAAADASPGLLLWRTTNRWQAVIREALAPFALTHVQFVLLAALTWADAGDGLTQAELARFAQTDPMMTSQVLRALEAKGLVDRRPAASDRRALMVTPTADGIRLANAANAAVESADQAFFSAAAGERRTLEEHLRALDGSSRG